MKTRVEPAQSKRGQISAAVDKISCKRIESIERHGHRRTWWRRKP